MSAWLAANAVIALAVFTQSAAGIGYGLIAMPLLLLLNPSLVPGAALFIMLFLSLGMAIIGYRHIDRRGLGAIVGGLIPGSLLALFGFTLLEHRQFELVFAALITLALVAGMAGYPVPRRRSSLVTGGVVAGFIGTLAGIHGPAFAALYAQSDAARARATIACLFVIATVCSLLVLHHAGRFGQAELLSVPALLPGLGVGVLGAVVLNRHVSDRMARTMMQSLALLGCLAIVLRNLG